MIQNGNRPSVKQETLSPRLPTHTINTSVLSSPQDLNEPVPSQEANIPLAPLDSTKKTFQVDYYDHSREQCHQQVATNSVDDMNSRETSSVDSHSGDISRGGVTTPFQWKLHDMLEQIDEDGYSHAISWLSHGRAFMVHKPSEFVNQVMPIYFNQTKFASFQRQLNLYGFRRMTAGQDKGAYYHEFFLRGRRTLCQRMSRKKVKGTKVRRSTTSTCTGEPNFYEMSPMPSLMRTKKRANSLSSCSSSSTTSISVTKTTPESKQKKSKPVILSQLNKPILQIPVKPLDPPNAATILTKKILIASNKTQTSQENEDVVPTSSPATPTLTAETGTPPIVEGFSVPPPPFIGVPASAYTPSQDTAAFLPHKMQSNDDHKDKLDLLFFEGMPFHYLDKYNILGELKGSAGCWENTSNPAAAAPTLAGL